MVSLVVNNQLLYIRYNEQVIENYCVKRVIRLVGFRLSFSVEISKAFPRKTYLFEYVSVFSLEAVHRCNIKFYAFSFCSDSTTFQLLHRIYTTNTQIT